jgi:hypothetical protein
MCRVSARRLYIYNFTWRLLKATKKVILVPQKLKKKQKFIWSLSDGVCRLNPKSLKIIRTPNQLIRTEVFPKKYASTLKKKRSQKYVWELPDGICRLDSKTLKKIGISNQPINTKKSMFSTLKV